MILPVAMPTDVVNAHWFFVYAVIEVGDLSLSLVCPRADLEYGRGRRWTANDARNLIAANVCMRTCRSRSNFFSWVLIL